MLLDEIRNKIRIKKEELHADPDAKAENRKFLDSMDELFKNRDAILKCPKSVMLGTLMYVGYPYEDIRDIYSKLIDELNRVYKMVDPSALDSYLEKHRKKE